METKSWWKSKIFWASIAETITGLATLIIDGIESGVGWTVLMVGILTLISRIWFTNTTLSK